MPKKKVKIESLNDAKTERFNDAKEESQSQKVQCCGRRKSKPKGLKLNAETVFLNMNQVFETKC